MKDRTRVFVKGNTSFIINVIRKIGIPIYDIKEQENGSTIVIQNRHLKRVEKCLIDHHRDYQLKERFGLFFLVKSLMKRVGIFIALAFSIFACSYYSNFLFGVEIVGDDLPIVDEAEIVLEDYTFPVKKTDVDLEAIEAKAYLIDGVSYATATIEGNRIKLQLVGTSIPNNLIDLDTPKDIVATTDSIVTKIVAYQGTPMVKVGDIVKEGSVLISSTIKLTEELSVDIAAAGEVYGRVFRSQTLSYPNVSLKDVPTGRTSSATSISFLQFKNTISSPYQYYDKEVKEIFSLPLLNIFIKSYTFYEKEIKEVNMDFENNIDDIVNSAYADFENRLPDDSLLLNRRYEVKRLDNYYILELYYETEEKIYESKNHRQST